MDQIINEKFRNALERRPQNVPPVWMMRQAGRYHRHYQELRRKHSFDKLCRNPELACEVALGPIEDFDFDVAILFSDILFVLNSMGFGLEYTDKGPKLSFQLDESTFSRLKDGDPTDLDFQYQALKLTRKRLPKDKSLIGFVGGPWTLFGYSVEGSHQGGLKRAKALRNLFKPFCERLIPLMQENVRRQLESGAEVVMIFDTAAGELDPEAFHYFVVPGLELLRNKFPDRVGYYSKGTQAPHLAHPTFREGWAGLGFDHRWVIEECFKSSPGFVQGNFDQSYLTADRDVFRDALSSWIRPIEKIAPENRLGWVAALGHGVVPQAREENVREFVHLIRQHFGKAK